MRPANRFFIRRICAIALIFLAPFITPARAEEALASGEKENDGADIASESMAPPPLDLTIRHPYGDALSGAVRRAIEQERRERNPVPVAPVPEFNLRLDSKSQSAPAHVPPPLPAKDARAQAVDRLRDQYLGGFGRIESKSAGSRTRFDYLRSDKCKIKGWGVCLTMDY